MQAVAKLSSTYQEILASKIANRSARVGIIGLGYVGCPLAVEFGKVGFSVTGVDVAKSKVDTLNRGQSHIQDVPGDDIEELVRQGRLRATTDFSVISELDTVSICVPTPLRKTKDPDMSYIVAAC